MRQVPSRFRFKFYRRHRSDRWNSVFTFRLLARKNASASARAKRFAALRGYVFSSVQRLRRAVDRKTYIASRIRYQCLNSYRFPRFMGQRRTRITHYGRFLFSKQQFKSFYHYMRERQFSQFVRRHAKVTATQSSLYHYLRMNYSLSQLSAFSKLEFRLSSILRRSTFFYTIFEIRQAILHRKVLVNGLCVDRPNAVLEPGDIVTFVPDEELRIKYRVARFFKLLRLYRDRYVRRVSATFAHAPKRLHKEIFSVRVFKRTTIPSHLDVDYGLLSLAIVEPFANPATTFLPTFCAFNVKALIQSYQAFSNLFFWLFV